MAGRCRLRRSGRASASQQRAQPADGAAFYQHGELHRLRGEFAQAEEAYQRASRWGREPQPGLALLRLAQGRIDAAEAAIRRVVDGAQDRARGRGCCPRTSRSWLPPVTSTRHARPPTSCRSMADDLDAPLLRARPPPMRRARSCCSRATRAPHSARCAAAWAAWQELEVPYEAARVRVLIGLACRELGDDEAAEMELDAARWVFVQLGAATRSRAGRRRCRGSGRQSRRAG